MQLAIAGGFSLGPAIGGGLQQVHTLNLEVVVPVQYMKIFVYPHINVFVRGQFILWQI